MGRTRRVAVVGCGYMGREHIKAMGEGFTLVAGCDIDPKAMESLAGSVGRFDSLERMLDGVKVDLAVLALPSHLYPWAVERCAGSGIDVLCEKPMGTNGADAKRIIAAAKSAGIKLLVGAQRKYFVTMRAALDRVGEIKPAFITCAFSYPWPAFAGATWRHDRKQSGGIAIIDTGWHALDYLDWALGTPAAVQCRTTSLRGYPDIDNQAAVILEYPDGAIANLTFNYTSPIDAFDFAFYDADRSVTATPKRMAVHHGAEVVEEVIAPTGDDPMKCLYVELGKALDGEASAMFTDGARGERVMKVVEACYRSAADDGRRLGID